MTYPQVPAAYINCLFESGTKMEAINELQLAWNELVCLRQALRDIASGANDPRRVAQDALNPASHPTSERRNPESGS
jgi:hypothetical protein